LLDTTSEILNENVIIPICLEATDGPDLVTHQIGNHDVGSRRADINPNYATLPGINVKESGPAATTDRFAKSAFKDQAFLEKFTNQQAGNTASDIH
jgi:hypothetical protein